MSVNENETNSMSDAMEEIEASMKKVRNGEIVKGKVISVTDNEAIINLGYMSDGILAKNEISDDPEVNPKDVLKENDEIYVYILNMNDGEGNILLSKKAADKIKVWEELENSFKNGTTFEITVKEVVKGGVVTYIKGIRAFIPASQLSVAYVKDLNEFVNKTLEVKVIEFDRNKEKIVLSRKEVENVELEAKKTALWNDIKSGEKRKGIVSRLTKFGAFVDLGGVDGLIHLSQLSWKKVNNPSDVVSVGDKVEVYVLETDKENNRISLALKDVSEDPWNNVLQEYKIGSIVEGTISKFLNFGAFVELESGIEGLVHISEISEERILKPSDVLSIGSKVKVKILDIDGEAKKMSLSIKEALEKPKEDIEKYVDTQESGVSLGELFGDKFKDLKFD
ncbi:30S ribosomal protein S1 [Clostridium sp. PL3]|uniref:30S ribosomal protein S1 n=1 Tax=Clostridium thailandense TaxID=2794346 RepID=A0A949TJN2_9CLOT|nr:30S ribosomal protein S1 [Clostridium thailandense]MBV7273525.1 30S ribosomal protein S1 [Clostridium thailandense]